MDMQLLINGLFGIVGALLGVLYANMRSEIKKQDEILEELVKEVHELDKVVAGKYVMRDELKEYMKEIKGDLEKIFDKIDGKADKH